MKATREYRRWMQRMIQWAGKKNGKVRGALLDNPWMALKKQSSKKE